MAKAAKSKETETESGEIDLKSPQVQMAKYLNKTKDDHYSLEKIRPSIKISTGSLNLDMELKGGIGYGAHRVQGPANGGKSPFVLNVCNNFLDTVPNSRVIWCKAEGRLSDTNAARSNHKIVYTPEEWEVGTIFVFRNNIFEVWIGMMRDLIMNNPTDCRYAFVTDSLDGLNLKNDYVKTVEEGVRVGGAPLMTKQMFQKIGLALTEKQHLAIFIGQVSSEIKLNPYDKTPPRQTSGSGGSSIAHMSNEVLEFQEWFEGDLILDNPEEKHDRFKNRALGHKIRIKIKKSETENRYVTVEIPIKHGVAKGSAIWKEKEVVDQLLIWSLLSKKGAWYTLADPAREEIAKETSVPIEKVPEQFQGMPQFTSYLEKNPLIVEYFFKKFQDMIKMAISMPETT